MRNKKSKETRGESGLTKTGADVQLEQKKPRHKVPVVVWQILAVFVVIGVAVGVFLGVQHAFEVGIEEGREQLTEEISSALKELGTAVADKSEFVQKIKDTLADIPKELNSEKIDDFISKIEKLFNETKNDSVKSTLQEYLSKWKEFKDTYASEDNDAITEAFNALKSETDDTAEKIKKLYDETIKSAIEKL